MVRRQPHFLCNSLNSIVSPVVTEPSKAEQAVLGLGELFSTSLSQSGTGEQGRSGGYQLIEHGRSGDRLKLQWDIESVHADLPISPLPRQTLLENALIYGMQSRIEGGLVQNATNYLNEMSRLCLSSPYGGRGEQPASRGAQRALPDIDGCLVALFGAQSSLSVKRHDGRRYGRLRYPCTSLMQEARAL